MLIGRFFLIIPALGDRRLAGGASRWCPTTSGTLPDAHAAVRRAARRRRRDRRRPHLLPGPRAGPDPRAPVDLNGAPMTPPSSTPTARTPAPTAAERPPKVRTKPSRVALDVRPHASSARPRSTALRKLDPRVAGPQPGDVHRRGRRGAHHGAVRPRPRRRRPRRRTCSPAWSPSFLWFTVLFANFAEAMAEGRGKAQAATLRATRADTMASVLQRRRHDRRAVVGRAADRRPVRRGRRRGDPRRRRRRRGHRHRRRVGDHRRVGPGDPRERRRPLGGHRRHPGADRPDRRADHGASRARRSSTG